MDEPKDAGTGAGAAGAGACVTEADGSAEAAGTDASEEAFAQLQRLYDQLPAMEERGVLLASGAIEKHQFIVRHTRSKRDCHVDIPRLERILEKLKGRIKAE